MNFDNTNTIGGTLVQGGVSALALSFFSSALSLMMPFFFAAFALILVDLHFGCEAARKRGEYRLSRAIRLTINKCSEYVCWIILSATLSTAFHREVINYIILAIVMGNELISIISNYLLIHNKRIKGLNSFFIRLLGDKLHANVDGVEIEDLNPDNDNNKDGERHN